MTSDKAYSVEQRLNAIVTQQVSPRSQAINFTAAANIGGLSYAVLANQTYFAHAHLVIEWNAAAGQPELQFAGPAVSQFDVTHVSRQSGTSSITNTTSEALAGTSSGNPGYGAFFNPTVVMTGTGIFFVVDIWAWFTFTAAGTLTLQAASTVAADPWIVFSGFWRVWQ